MGGMKPEGECRRGVKTALVSVYDKTGLADFVAALARSGVTVVASGGTGAFLKQAGLACRDVSEITGRNELLGGLVKTLHPGIHAGILADGGRPEHRAELAALGYSKIDMVVVNFYALPERPGPQDLSFIDIGGPAMARAASKNFASCVPVPDPSWYAAVAAELEAHGDVPLDLRWQLAADTLARTGAYDARVLALVGEGLGAKAFGSGAAEAPVGSGQVLLGLSKCLDLRYGENPHQQAGFFTSDGKGAFTVLKGSLSYNNILDLGSCVDQLAEFDGRAAVVVKHLGPCGVAQAGPDEAGARALQGAYECDPQSAFGGVVAVNFPFDAECADFLAKRFVECIIAPEFEEAALAVLVKKKSRLVASPLVLPRPAGGEATGTGPAATGATVRSAGTLLRSALGGVLVQSRDAALLAGDLKFVSGGPPPAAVLSDLIFAWKAAKHVKSNAIVFAKGGRTLGIGAGQPSRVDSTKLAILKAAQAGHDLKGSVVASDGFFPFPDSVELAAVAGAVAAIQPGGSIRDQEVIAAAEKIGIVMAMTSIRHFKH